MKTFSALLLSVLCMTPFLANARPLRQMSDTASRQAAISRAIFQQQNEYNNQKQASSKDSFAQAQQALNQLIQQNKETVSLSWEDFIEKNKQAQQRARQELQETEEELAQAFSDSNASVKFEGKNTPIDYAKILSGIKIIYIGQSHGIEDVPPEVMTLLRTVRQNNPNARILLASEFALRQEATDPYIKKAGTADPWRKSYPSLFQTADELNIDQLALDDQIFTIDKQKDGFYLGTKIGAYEVTVPCGQDISDSTFPYMALATHYKIHASTWGVAERNRQWARYINAVKPFYDVIVVHCGMGHLIETTSTDLLVQIHMPPAALFLYFPMKEQYAEVLKKYADMSDSHLRQENLMDPTFINEETAKLLREKTGISLQDWKDFSKPFWFMFKSEGTNPNSTVPKVSLSVYLPILP